jgi:DNA invertase Pin-like site-specific DNA recombinase
MAGFAGAQITFCVGSLRSLKVWSQTSQGGTEMKTVIGYARVNTTDQNLEIQEAALRAACREVIRSEKRSGMTTNRRTELQTVLDFLRQGDVLMVTRIDRLARSIGDLQEHSPRCEGQGRRAQPIDTSTAVGKCFLDMLGVFSEFEINQRKERQHRVLRSRVALTRGLP